MSLSDTHQPKTKGAATKPAVFVDGASGTTGLGIAERLRLQSDIAVREGSAEYIRRARTELNAVGDEANRANHGVLSARTLEEDE